MIIYPAIDLRDGQVVRLKEGDPKQQTIFSADPAATAQSWIDRGAKWIHMVNLDGALATANNNERILERAAKLDVKIQFGGGLRQIEDIERAIDCGASRVVLGTVAIQQPEIVTVALERWGAEAICIALDARDGKITTHGWQQVTDQLVVDYGKLMARQRVRHVLYTDVKRDGQLSGANLDDTIALGRETGLQVIASGGISSIQEIQQLAQSGYVAGAIIGMALYQGQLTLADALEAAEGK